MSTSVLSARTGAASSTGEASKCAHSCTSKILNSQGLDNNLVEALAAFPGLDVLVRRKTVTALTGTSTATLYRLIEKGTFPRPVELTRSARAWRLSDVIEWIATRQQVSASKIGEARP